MNGKPHVGSSRHVQAMGKVVPDGWEPEAREATSVPGRVSSQAPSGRSLNPREQAQDTLEFGCPSPHTCSFLPWLLPSGPQPLNLP